MLFGSGMVNITEHKKLFKSFAKKYIDSGDEAFRIKIAHTGDVVRIITSLGKKLKLKKRQLFLTQLTALYHDLGRFVQYEKYKTFNDNVSIDHSMESVKILQELNFLKDLSLEEQSLIKQAIIEHNKKDMSRGLSKNEMYLSMLIRDADKLSNFPFFLKNYDKFKLLKSNVYNSEFIQSILVKKPISNTALKTIEDYYLYHLSWFNDLNYKISIDYAIAENYISRIIARIADSDTQARLTSHFENIQSNSTSYQECEF